MPAPAAKRNNRTVTASDTVAVAIADPLGVDPAAIEVAKGTDIPEIKTEEIASLAYSYWEARGCQGGSPDGDWLRAEEEVRARRAEGS
jgi:hypothetical protein